MNSNWPKLIIEKRRIIQTRIVIYICLVRFLFCSVRFASVFLSLRKAQINVDNCSLRKALISLNCLLKAQASPFQKYHTLNKLQNNLQTKTKNTRIAIKIKIKLVLFCNNNLCTYCRFSQVHSDRTLSNLSTLFLPLSI